MDRHAAWRIVRRLARQAGINKPVSPHTLRHAFISAALDAGVPRRDVQVGSQLDASRSIDDDRGHTSPAARASPRVSAAFTPGSTGSPTWRRSSHAANDSGVTSSSGLTTTTAGSAGTSGRRATTTWY